jgi:cyclopropane-fatty-acyl-phospholipid synthase
MSLDRSRSAIQRLLDIADVKIDGDRPWDIQVHNEGLYDRVMAGGSLALGEAYMDRWWDCANLDEFFTRILKAGLDSEFHSWSELLHVATTYVASLQERLHPTHASQAHYDIGNDLYRIMLGSRMLYSSGYWQNAETLDEAQEAKLELICRKLDLHAGLSVLEIGCGWGGAARYMAEQFDVKVTGITTSREQAAYAIEYCHGLPIEILVQDYRDVTGEFDRICSVGMLEHVGHANYGNFMRCVRDSLRDDGRFLLHSIGGNQVSTGRDPWLETYIFPHSMLPAPRQLCQATEGLFVMEDWHNFGADYDRTLMSWFHNFEAAWPTMFERYGDRFGRMWRYYLLCCAGTFRARKSQFWQILYSPQGIPGGFRRWEESPRDTIVSEEGAGESLVTR